MKKMNKKGFTLAELLIVVAIIAVLVAIAIPVFSTQLEKSRDSVSVSNMRAAYAEAMAAYLTGTDDGTHVKCTKDDTTGAITDVEVDGVAIKSQKEDTWSGLAAELPWNVGATSVTPDDPGTPNNNMTIKFSFTDGEISGVTLS